jgi:hypothetical protein
MQEQSLKQEYGRRNYDGGYSKTNHRSSEASSVLADAVAEPSERKQLLLSVIDTPAADEDGSNYAEDRTAVLPTVVVANRLWNACRQPSITPLA